MFCEGITKVWLNPQYFGRDILLPTGVSGRDYLWCGSLMAVPGHHHLSHHTYNHDIPEFLRLPDLL